MSSTTTDYATRVAELRVAEQTALAAVTVAADKVARAIARRTKSLVTLNSAVAATQADLAAAQGEYVVAVGVERAAQVLGISSTAARGLKPTASTPDVPPGRGPGGDAAMADL